jgi:hypothetical protein
MNKTAVMNYALVDDILLLPPNRVRSVLATIPRLSVECLGPLVEYAFHQRRLQDVLPPIDTLVTDSRTGGLHGVMANGSTSIGTSLKPCGHEFNSPNNESPNGQLYWRAFVHRLKFAAEHAGFDGSTASGLAGAFGELLDNARIHSMKLESVVVGYRWCQGEFEMVVADAGVGVLESLRSHPDYRTISDYGEALKTALSSGETRFGRGSGHGTGFDTVFRNIASLSGSLRFRSGDHSLELDGTGLTLLNSKLKQRMYFQGFMISVVCRTNVVR